MTDSEYFNDLPFETRVVCSNLETATRIRDLQRQKERLKANYEREMKFINDKIANLERWLKQNPSTEAIKSKGK
jgi:hypothetical protein